MQVSRCPRCGGILEFAFDPEHLKEARFKGDFTFWRYRPVLPHVPKPISLGEGGTPLHEARRLGGALGLERLLLKDETRNPTSSFKDRSAALVISDAAGSGFDAVVCATNGNLGASLAAYAARVDVACHLIVPTALDIGKLAQMIAYDADVEEAGGSIEDAIDRASRLAEETGWYQATTELNPLAVEALKTIAYELAEQAPVPDWMVVAMGSGATIHAVWKGFRELEEMGAIEQGPRLVGVQAAGCSPIAEAFILGGDRPTEIEKAETEATAIRVRAPLYGSAALEALRDSGGLAISVTDEELLDAEREIARSEGIFAEPASAATVACLRHLLESGEMGRGDSVVSLITSSGLKTDDILRNLSGRRRSPGIGSRLATKERILRTIDRRRTYGYDLWKSMGKKMTLGAVYQHLSDLENRGLIASYTEGKRRYLRITERGRRVLEALKELRSLL
ncbi:hypothetical protein AC482_05650 [miscellaneous Crenarchaeota group-15 archaeon DG-45]|uniref:Threonine synthase n=1 Tax=miscellaneous Crenarchaeota group-15 archaeon DG-45 TaxID=1685127 RepID=A0A0M0BMV4_9ARCH|nr:MAG: hypothetical protein AC482_05650 [miscellaneous Crenarchaeota group-15 archaeon DG-45]